MCIAVLSWAHLHMQKVAADQADQARCSIVHQLLLHLWRISGGVYVWGGGGGLVSVWNRASLWQSCD